MAATEANQVANQAALEGEGNSELSQTEARDLDLSPLFN